MDSQPLFHWCAECKHPVFTSQGNSCPTCGGKLTYFTTEARPVFARERRILQFYGHGPLTAVHIHLCKSLAFIKYIKLPVGVRYE